MEWGVLPQGQFRACITGHSPYESYDSQGSIKVMSIYVPSNEAAIL